jgi:long-chain acyl-CoA synthetase
MQSRLVFSDPKCFPHAADSSPCVVFKSLDDVHGFNAFIDEGKTHDGRFEPIVPHENEAALFLSV